MRISIKTERAFGRRQRQEREGGEERNCRVIIVVATENRVNPPDDLSRWRGKGFGPAADMGRYIITINVYWYNMYIYIIEYVWLWNILIWLDKLYISWLLNTTVLAGRKRWSDTINEPLHLYYCMQSLTAVGLCIMIINNSVVFTEICIIFKRGTLIVLNQIYYKYFLISGDARMELSVDLTLWEPYFDINV